MMQFSGDGEGIFPEVPEVFSCWSEFLIPNLEEAPEIDWEIRIIKGVPRLHWTAPRNFRGLFLRCMEVESFFGGTKESGRGMKFEVDIHHVEVLHDAFDHQKIGCWVFYTNFTTLVEDFSDKGGFLKVDRISISAWPNNNRQSSSETYELLKSVGVKINFA